VKVHFKNNVITIKSTQAMSNLNHQVVVSVLKRGNQNDYFF